MKTELLGGKIRFLGGEKKTQGWEEKSSLFIARLSEATLCTDPDLEWKKK
jgi:hypothetical protein